MSHLPTAKEASNRSQNVRAFVVDAINRASSRQQKSVEVGSLSNQEIKKLESQPYGYKVRSVMDEEGTERYRVSWDNPTEPIENDL